MTTAELCHHIYLLTAQQRSASDRQTGEVTCYTGAGEKAENLASCRSEDVPRLTLTILSAEVTVRQTLIMRVISNYQDD